MCKLFNKTEFKIKASQKDKDYPVSFQLNNLPQIKDQGKVGSCTAFAMSSILEWHDHNQHTLSTNFLYGFQNVVYDWNKKGLQLTNACKLAVDYGDMLEEDCSGNNEYPECVEIAKKASENEEAMSRAYQFSIKKYAKCKSSYDIKYALINYGPVLGIMNWYNNCELVDDVYTITKYYNPTKHSIVIYGWNEKGWLIQNSMGEKLPRFVLPYDLEILDARAVVSRR